MLDKDKQHMLIGALVVGILGVGASILLSKANPLKHKKSPLQVIGQTLAHFGEVLENSEEKAEDTARSLFGSMEKLCHKAEGKLESAIDWAMKGFKLLKAIKKGV